MYHNCRTVVDTSIDLGDDPVGYLGVLQIQQLHRTAAEVKRVPSRSRRRYCQGNARVGTFA